MFEVATTQQNNDSSILGTLNRGGEVWGNSIFTPFSKKYIK